MTLLQRKRSADIEIKWATLYAESALFQYDVTRDEIKNTVLTESCEDVYTLMESAWSTVKDKLIEAIKKIFEGAYKIISYIADKIQELFKSKDLEKKKKVLDEVKKIPEAKNVKVEIDDRDESNRNIKSFGDKVQRLKSKVFAKKKLTESELKDLDDAEKRAKAPVKKITVGALATAGTILASLATIKTAKMTKDLKQIGDDYINAMAEQNEEEQKIQDGTSSKNEDAIKLARAEAKLHELQAIASTRDASILSKLFYPLASLLSGNRDNASDERISDAQRHLDGLRGNP